jgi:hypothetical protein
VKALLKSLGFGVVGAGLSFSFLAMITVPLVAAWSRLHNPNTPLQSSDVLIEPFGFLRLIGLPLAAAAFAACFALGWRKFARQPAPPPSSRAVAAPVEHHS